MRKIERKGDEGHNFIEETHDLPNSVEWGVNAKGEKTYSAKFYFAPEMTGEGVAESIVNIDKAIRRALGTGIAGEKKEA